MFILKMTFHFTLEAFSNHSELLLSKLSKNINTKYNIVKTNYFAKSSKGWVQMFLLSSGLFILINSHYLRCNLNSFFLEMSVERWWHVEMWPFNKMWSTMANLFRISSPVLLSDSQMLGCSHKKLPLSITIIRCVAATTQKFLKMLF